MSQPGALVYDADFKANTSEGQKALRDYAAEIKAVRTAIGESAREAKEHYQQHSIAARAAGASTERLAEIQQEYAQKQISLKNAQKQLTDEIVKGNFSALKSEEALKVIRQETLEQIEKNILAVKELAEANAHSGHTVSGQAAASGSVQLLDGRGGIRTIENFLGNTLGLGGFFSVMFPIVGAVQSGKLLYELGENVYEVGHKASQAGAETTRWFDEQHAKAQTSIDDLAVQADKIQLNIDKLEGHPGNGVKLALDEARVAADKLLASLLADRKELEALFKEQSVGFVGSLLTGEATTGGQQKNILSDHKDLEAQIKGIQQGFFKDAASAKSQDDIKRAGDRRDNAIRGAIQKTIDTYRTEAKRLADEQARSLALASLNATGEGFAPVGNSTKISQVSGVADKLQDFLTVFNGQLNLASLSGKEDTLKGQKEAGTLSAEAARKALEAQKKAAEEQRKQWDSEIKAAEAAANLTHKQIATLWLDRENQAKRGSENARYADDHYHEELKRANDEERKLLDEKLKMMREFGQAAQKDLFGGIAEGGKQQAATIIAQESLARTQRDVALRVAESGVQSDLAAGKISKYDAAVQMQTLHTMAYENALTDLNQQLAALQLQPGTGAAQANVQKQITELNGRRTTEQMQDTATVGQTTVAGALKQANQLWLQDSQDLAPKVAGLYKSAFSGLNDQLSDLMTNQKTSWSSLFRGIASELSHLGLNMLEGQLVKSIGGIGVGNSISGFFGSLFGGARAGGGGVEAGKSYLVGEHGPEIATFGSNAYITPNHKIGSSFGTSHNWNVQVDARGSNNPAEVEEAANRAVVRAVPHIMSGVLQAQQDRMARLPSSKR